MELRLLINLHLDSEDYSGLFWGDNVITKILGYERGGRQESQSE